MKKRVVFILITFITFPIIAFLAVEFALWVFGVGTTYEKEDPFLGFQTISPLFEQTIVDSAGATMFVTRQDKLPWFNYQKFAENKPGNGYRIFCFGGSTTYGHPYTFKTSFSNWLEVILQDLVPEKQCQVINVGGISYASYRIINLMQEMLQYSPDLFIVYSGHNEFLENRTYSQLIEASKFITSIRTALNRSRTYSGIRAAWLKLQTRKREQAQQKFQMTGEVKPILDQSFGLARYQRDPAWEKAVLNHFYFNLVQMIRIARQNGINIIFVVPPSNEKDFSPFKSQLSDSISPAKIDQWQRFYHQGRLLLEQREYNSARQAFQAALTIDSSYADLRFRLGQCFLALKQYQEAKHEFVQAVDLDIAPLRATTAIQQIVRNVGHAHKVATIDFVKILEHETEKSQGHTLLGREIFLDHAHPTIEVHQLLAEEIARVMAKTGMIKAAKPVGAANLRALYDSVMVTIDSTYYAMRDLNLAKVLDWAGKREEAVPFIMRAAEAMPYHPETRFLRGFVYQDQGNFTLATRDFQAAIELDSTYAKAYNALGAIYEKTDQLEAAITCFKAAIRHSPGFDLAYYNLGNTLYRQGHNQAALTAYQQALTLNPGNWKAMNNLGVIYMLQGDLDKATTAFTNTLNLDPQNVNAIDNLGMIYYRQGDLNRAREMFKQALTINPGDEFARQWLNRIQGGD